MIPVHQRQMQLVVVAVGTAVLAEIGEERQRVPRYAADDEASVRPEPRAARLVCCGAVSASAVEQRLELLAAGSA
ncbi:hypothetical protein D3C84_1173520 [compost metagenome]